MIHGMLALLIVLQAPASGEERKAVAKALEYLVRSQDPDGSWKCNEDGPGAKELKRFGKPPDRIFATALAALALLEHGGRTDGSVASGSVDTAEALNRAVRHVTDYVTEGHKCSVVNPTWLFSVSGLLLARVQRLAPTEENAKVCRGILAELDAFVETTGAWGHGRVDRPNMKVSIGYNDLAAAHNWACFCLAEMKRAGIEVPERMLARATEFYDKAQFTDGGLAYNLDGRKRNTSEESTLGEGRSVAQLPGLLRLAPKSEAAKRATDYARRHLGDVLTHHTPWMHLVAAAWGMEDLGGKDLSKFDHLWRKKILGRLAADGHARPWSEGRTTSDPLEAFKSGADRDGQIGPAYTTACFLLILKPAGTRAEYRPDTPTESSK